MRKEEFIEKAKKVHSDRYDYSFVDYKNKNESIIIICSTHGPFTQLPRVHLRGSGCRKCGNEKISESRKLENKKSLKERLNEIHGDKYDYSNLTDAAKTRDYVNIICPIHGEFFQKLYAHLNGQGCPYCGNAHNYSTKEFIEKAKKVHGEKYDYSFVDYKNATTKIKIICEKHGIFEQKPNFHLNGCGCPFCNESKGEKEIARFLDENNIKYEREKRFSECKDKYTLPFDFFLPDYNILIEYDGIQHFSQKSWNRFNLSYVQKHDEIKNKFAEKNGIKLIRISFQDFKNIKSILKNIF